MAKFFVAPIAVEAPYKAKPRAAWIPPKATIAGRDYCAHAGKPCPVWVRAGEAYCRRHHPV